MQNIREKIYQELAQGVAEPSMNKKSEQQPKKMKFMFYYLMNLPQIKPRVAPLRSPYSALRIESKPTPCLQLICKKCQDQRLLLSLTRQ